MLCLLMIKVSYCDINIVKNSLSSALYSKVLSINFIYLLKYSSLFLAHNAFVRTNRRTIAVMFFRLSVCLGWVCIVIIWCTLAWI